VKRYPEEVELYNLKALLEILNKNTDLAIKTYQKVIALNQESIKAHLGLAKLFLNENNYLQAKKHADKALSINDKSIYAYFLLADIARKENKQQDVESLLLIAQVKAEGNISQEMKVANNLLKIYIYQKHPEKILPVAQDIIKRYPDNSKALSLLAAAQLYNNHKKLAIESLEQLINQEPEDIFHRLLLARLLLNQSEKEKQVLQLLDEVSLIEPNNVQMLIQKTVLLIHLKHLKKAMNAAEKVKQLSPETGLGEVLEGDIYLAGKKMDQALKAYLKAYQFKSTGKILNVLVSILVAQNRQSDAVIFLNKELKKNKKNIIAHLSLAGIYGQKNNVNEAKKHYKAILAEQPDNVVALNNLALLYHQKNNPQALLLAEKAYELAPDTAAILDTYATVLVAQGDVVKGINLLERAVSLTPAAYDLQYNLAKAYALNGMHDQAIKTLNEILKADLNFTKKNAASDLLKKLEVD